MKIKIPQNPYLLTIITFLILILIGGTIIAFSFNDGQVNFESFKNGYFLATSSVCVTGLSTVANLNESLNLVGKIVMMVLIFLGGLGMITFLQSLLAFGKWLFVNKDISYSSKYMLREILNVTNAKEAQSSLKRTLMIALIIQTFFAMYYCVYFSYIGQEDAIVKGIFHSISSFNNAGFDLFGSNSLVPFKNDLFVMIPTMLEIVFGGLGFIVIFTLFTSFNYIGHKLSSQFKVHSIVVIGITLLLISAGFLIFLFSKMEPLNALFQSITARTAGFYTVDQEEFFSASEHMPAFVSMIILMFIGAGPCSTAGGIKVTTIYIIVHSIFRNSLGKPADLKISKRTITEEMKNKAFMVFGAMILSVVIGVLAISIAESVRTPHIKNLTLGQILFETVSSLGTVGVSMGLTSKLCVGSQVIICFLMLIGRLGPLTFISVFRRNWLNGEIKNSTFSKADIYIG